MARILIDPVEARRQRMAAQIEADCGARKRHGPSTKNLLEGFVEQAASIQDWAIAEPKHFVGLHLRLHESIYGAPDEALGRRNELMAALTAVRVMLEKDFRDSPEALADFLRWVWRRERAQEEKRQANGDGGGYRLTWRKVFRWRDLLTDYRVSLQRARNGHARRRQQG